MQANIAFYDKPLPDSAVTERRFAEPDQMQYRVELQLFGADSRPVFADPASKPLYVLNWSNDIVRFVCPVSDPEKWSAENPVLYTLVLSLKNPDGEVLETTKLQGWLSTD